MDTFEKRRIALESLGWSYTLEYEYRGKRGNRKEFKLDLFSAVQVPLTPDDWCRLCMRESSEYVGGCCGNLSAVQDHLNEWFREGGWVKVHELVSLGEAMRDHGDEDFKDVESSSLHNMVYKFLSTSDSQKANLSAWSKIALVYHLVRDHYSPNVSKAQSLDSNEIEGALLMVSRLSRAIGMDDFFKRLSATRVSPTTESAQKIMRLYRFLPAFKMLHERLHEIAPESVEGYAVVDLEKGEGEIAENGLGYCIYATRSEADRYLQFIQNGRDQRKDESFKDGQRDIFDEFKIRPVRVSLGRGIEFLDDGQGPKIRTKRRHHPRWMTEDVEDVEMLFEQYVKGQKIDESTKEKILLAWVEAARLFS